MILGREGPCGIVAIVFDCNMKQRKKIISKVPTIFVALTKWR